MSLIRVPLLNGSIFLKQIYSLRRTCLCTTVCLNKSQIHQQKKINPDILEKINKLYNFFKRPDYYKRDKIRRQDYELIYNANIDNYVKGSQLAVSSTTFLMLASLAYYLMLYLEGKDISFPYGILESKMEIIISFLSLLGLLYAVSFLYLRVPYRIYYCKNTDEFLFLFCSRFNVFKYDTIKCKSGEMKKLLNPIYPDLTGEYCVKNKRMILHIHKFTYPMYYNMLLGIRLKD